MYERNFEALAVTAANFSRAINQVAETQNRLAATLAPLSCAAALSSLHQLEVGSAFADLEAAGKRIGQAMASFEPSMSMSALPSSLLTPTDEPQLQPSVVEAMAVPPPSAVDRRIEEQAVEIAALKARVEYLERLIQSKEAQNPLDHPLDGYGGLGGGQN